MSIFKKIGKRLRRKALERATIAELSGLSDRDLADIGISRSDIRFVAKRSAR